MTLNLKKQASGYYTNSFDGIQVIVSEFNRKWELTILDNNAADDECQLLSEWFSTKKEAYKFGANWIMTELKP